MITALSLWSETLTSSLKNLHFPNGLSLNRNSHFTDNHIPSTRCCLRPCLQLTMAPLRQIVHVLQELRPSHHTWCRIWRHEVRASALRECANFFAHVYADPSELVLYLHTMGNIKSQARLLRLRTLHVKI